MSKNTFTSNQKRWPTSPHSHIHSKSSKMMSTATANLQRGESVTKECPFWSIYCTPSWSLTDASEIPFCFFLSLWGWLREVPNGGYNHKWSFVTKWNPLHAICLHCLWYDKDIFSMYTLYSYNLRSCLHKTQFGQEMVIYTTAWQKNETL